MTVRLAFEAPRTVTCSQVFSPKAKRQSFQSCYNGFNSTHSSVRRCKSQTTTGKGTAMAVFYHNRGRRERPDFKDLRHAKDAGRGAAHRHRDDLRDDEGRIRRGVREVRPRLARRVRDGNALPVDGQVLQEPRLQDDHRQSRQGAVDHEVEHEERPQRCKGARPAGDCRCVDASPP